MLAAFYFLPPSSGFDRRDFLCCLDDPSVLIILTGLSENDAVSGYAAPGNWHFRSFTADFGRLDVGTSWKLEVGRRTDSALFHLFSIVSYKR
mmetsp:Transcript_12076/g.25496  ORF Transcript_12076/g.25496 Transcript_12076/m.25496 type:complete len:92 (-) Transcript_12076:71-346(-)